MAEMTRAQLEALNDSNITTNGAQENTGARVKAVVAAIIESVGNRVDDGQMVPTAGKPLDSFGIDGMLAFDKTALIVYEKAAGSWDAGTAIVSLPRYASEADLPANPPAGSVAILEDGPQLAIDDGSGNWITQLFDAYDVSAATVALLEDAANFTSGVFSGSAIDSADLLPGKRHIDTSNSNIEYLCIGTSNTAYWVKLDYAGGGAVAAIGAVSAATITLLENESNWWGSAGPNMYDPASTAIEAADLVAGKSHVKGDENISYECITQAGNTVWIRTGNRHPVSVSPNILAEGEAATVATHKTQYLSSGDFVFTHIEATVGNIPHAGGDITFSIDDDGVEIASVSLADGETYGSDSTGLPVVVDQGSKLEIHIDAIPATPGEGHGVNLCGFMKYKKPGQAGGGGTSAFSWTDFGDVYADFSDDSDMITETGFDHGDGNTDYFLSKPNAVAANAGSANGDEIYAPTTVNHATGEGWVKIPGVGIKIKSAELAIQMRMFDGANEAGLNTPGGEGFLEMFVEYFQKGMSKNRRERNAGPKSKYQNNTPNNIRHEDNFEPNGDGTGAIVTSINVEWGSYTPDNDDLLFSCRLRDIDNQRYYQWAGLIQAGATRADLVVNDTISQSTADGQVLYLDTTGGLANDSQSHLEYFAQEETTFVKALYKKISTETFTEINTAVGDAFELAVSELA